MDIDISLDYGLTLLAALLVGTGFVLQQNAAQPEPDSRFLSLRLILDLFHKPRWLLGIGCMVAGVPAAIKRSDVDPTWIEFAVKSYIETARHHRNGLRRLS